MSTSLYTPETPATVREAQGLHLITQSTPNGQKVQILLEELKDVYNTQWTTTLIDIRTNVQKSDWFLRLNPNGRIPVIVDNTQSPPFPVMETSAELLYLLKTADKEDIFGFEDELERSQCLQWLFFWHGGGAPNQGQLNFFSIFAKEEIPYAISRFRTETLRNFNVLEIRLSGKYTGQPRDYLAGAAKGKYSVADMGTWPWVKGWKFAGFSEDDMKPFPHLMAWVDRIAGREAVQRALGEKYETNVDVAKQAGAGEFKHSTVREEGRIGGSV
ncbi:MAG: hypothetical protein LQ348_007288 [Seirophora lacunosa]|nr:MAG: hypothetical protein LQ348_007288 [Seirophora lacunosa]